tara:strand:- start:1271 stop:1546 length:276 start_codon:yes stop_codon:yes gene_type:complete
MTRNDIESFITNATNADVFIPDNLDEGFVGVDVEATPPRAVYSIDRCIAKLAEEMSTEEATEYFWYNVAGASGVGYPIYISTPESEDASPY